jgi:hypothetical protein
MLRGKQGHELESYSPRLGFTVDQGAVYRLDAEALLRVASVADLQRLVERQRLHLLPAKRAHINVELPWLAADQRERWGRILTEHYYQCGCRHGAAFLLIGLLLLIARLVFFGLAPLGVWYLLTAPLFLFLLSGAGKIGGILWSRFQLRRAVSHLLDMRQVDGSQRASLQVDGPDEK